MLNPASPIPLYRQLADLLADQIGKGDYPPGSRIPSEPRLSAMHGIGRPTVRQAIDALARKGLLSRRRGSGTYVRESAQEVDLFSLDGTSASFRKKGLAVTTRIIEPVQLVRVESSEENPFAGRSAYFLTRMTLSDQAPVLIDEVYLDPELFAGLDRFDLQGRSLSAIAEQHYFLKPVGGRQSFTISYLQGPKARFLNILPETPVLLVRRYLHFPRIENGVFAQVWCRTDQFVFSQNIGGNPNA
jgi:GntR family transcriptional regulator